MGGGLLGALAETIAKRVREARQQAAAAADAAQQRARDQIAARAQAGDPQAIALMDRIRALDRAKAAPAPPAATGTVAAATPGALLPVSPRVAARLPAAGPSSVAASALAAEFSGTNLLRAIVVAEALAPPIALR